MKKQIILLFIVMLTVFSCKKSINHPVPLVPTDITININLPSYNALTGVGGYAYVAGGSKGIIVYRRAQEEFIAWDRHSPADVNGSCSRPLTPFEGQFSGIRGFM